MASTLIPIAALLLSSAFLLMAGGLHGLLLPIQGNIEGFTTVELGLIGTGWSVGFLAGCLVMPAVVRRVGHVRSYGVMASVAAVSILLNLLIVSPEAWIALRGLSGFCFAGAAMIVKSWLNERASKENRGTIFSVYQMVVFAGSTAGQLLMVITPPKESFFFAIGAILYCLAILPTALSTAQHPQPLKTARLDIRRLYAELAGRGDRLRPDRHGQRRLRHARRGLRPEDRPPDTEHCAPHGRRGARRLADPVPARPAVGQDGPAEGADRGLHRRDPDRPRASSSSGRERRRW